MSILKTIRRNKLVNGFFRTILKNSSKLSAKTHSFLINRWTPSGVLDCSFGPYKFKYFNAADDGLPHYFYYNLPYPEKADLNLFTLLAKQAKTIVDIGANTGLFSVLASIANTQAKIFAIEPYSANVSRMKSNLDLNLAHNVTIHQIAISETNGEIEIAVPKDNSITDSASADHNFSKHIYPDKPWINQKVKAQTLDNFASEHKIKIDLIKCDVETFEMSVFKGMDRILTEDKPVIIFECFLDEERKAFFNSILVKYNYYVYLILDQGLVHTQEGFVNSSYGLNYLIIPVKPSSTFVQYENIETLLKRNN